MKKYARPFPLLTQLIKGADRPMRNGHEVSNEFVTRASERATPYAREEVERIAKMKTAPSTRWMRRPGAA